MGQPGGDTSRGRLGRRGEDIAAAFLRNAGFRIIERNWRCARGEIDIVAIDAGDLVFVEVKTRSNVDYGYPLESITQAKLARLRSLAAAWCQVNPSVRGRTRIDAIGVLAPRNAPYSVHHVTGVLA